MGFMRTCGLIFFMTILVGGCIVAVSSQPPPDPVAHTPEQITWDQAVMLLHQGRVVSVTQTLNKVVYLRLADGTRLMTTAPSWDALSQVLSSCGDTCGKLQTVDV